MPKKATTTISAFLVLKSKVFASLASFAREGIAESHGSARASPPPIFDVAASEILFGICSADFGKAPGQSNPWKAFSHFIISAFPISERAQRSEIDDILWLGLAMAFKSRISYASCAKKDGNFLREGCRACASTMSATRKRRKGSQDEGWLLGAHVSTAGGVASAIDRACAIGCTAMQIFVKNNMQWFAKPLGAAEVRAFREHPLRDSLRSVFGHSGYLINLAASDPALHELSMRSLREELVRANQLGLPFLVLHPGAHMGRGVEAGLEKVVASLDAICGMIPEVETRIALETTAGQGSSLGRTFEELAFILRGCREPERLCVCIDTAHLFAAGYDLGSDEGIRRTFAQFKKLIGFKRLAAIHMNDSKVGAGSRVDRHEHIGKGKIGVNAFRYIMREPRFRNIPKVLETPKGRDMAEDVVNLATLRTLGNCFSRKGRQGRKDF